jgi:pimeloyl-ACP methyl ester carboxylesterase
VAAVALVVAAPAAAAASITATPIRTVHVDGTTIGYRSVGHGRPLVLVMGLSGSMDAWEPAFVDGLARRHRVVVFDNAGIRRSTAPAGPLTIDAMADDTARLVGALHLRRPDVLGWSMGGMIAQSLALQHPALVRRLVLAATAPGDGHAVIPDADVVAALSGLGGSGPSLASLLFPAGHEDALAAYASGILRYPDSRPAAPAEVVRAQVLASGTWLAGQDPVGRRLPRLRPPTLVAAGTLDRILSPLGSRHIAATAPHAALALCAGAAHGFLYQDRARFTAAIERFLR